MKTDTNVAAEKLCAAACYNRWAEIRDMINGTLSFFLFYIIFKYILLFLNQFACAIMLTI